MKKKKTSEAQTRANKKWNEANREKANYMRSKSSAKSFIRNKATLEDIAEMQELLDERRKQL
ncbi:hypothetical protein NSA50_19560 [Clostridium sp. DSM 100503]|uniref:hypothetical protein n=1 Tax=Clostridium sp. DSM 100503 TaxID=2963282 RepID=UPI002149B927|nr:hypothetical protein [Clostridium sp. DSM 100503]MCR1953186.1 hypothetical protein [Clostridium sp. DSM 100503]